jgi:hypothetical protein
VTRPLVLLALLVFSGFACRSLSLRGESVRVTRHKSDVEGCRFLGDVEAHPPFVGPKDAEHTLRNKAANLGGDVVVEHYGFGIARGKVYDCGGKFAR